MRFSENWLRTFVNPPFAGRELADALSMGGIDVEHVERDRDDWLITTKPTPNRGDCLSIRGLAREMAERIPGCEFMMVPGGTHTSPLEQPEMFALRIEKFLRTRILPKTLEAGPHQPGAPIVLRSAVPSLAEGARAVKHVMEAAVTEAVVPHPAPGADAEAAPSRRKKRASAKPAKKKPPRKKAARQPSDV